METPHIEFPCQYPIKVIGDVCDDAVSRIIEIVRNHAPEVTPDEVSTRQSRQGNYQSVRITIVATGEVQLQALHKELMRLPEVRMVL